MQLIPLPKCIESPVWGFFFYPIQEKYDNPKNIDGLGFSHFVSI
jgi:hypothetical protein